MCELGQEKLWKKALGRTPGQVEDNINSSETELLNSMATNS